MVAVSRRDRTAQKLLRSISVALRDRNRGKSATSIQQSVGPYSVCIAKLPTAAPLSLLSLVLLVRCAILRVCPRVVPGSMGAVLFYQWVDSARLDVALQSRGESKNGTPIYRMCEDGAPFPLSEAKSTTLFISSSVVSSVLAFILFVTALVCSLACIPVQYLEVAAER